MNVLIDRVNILRNIQPIRDGDERTILAPAFRYIAEDGVGTVTELNALRDFFVPLNEPF